MPDEGESHFPAETTGSDAEYRRRLGNAWLLLHQSARWYWAISNGQDVSTALRAIAHELDELAKPYSGCSRLQYSTGRSAVIGSYADAFRSLADAAKLMTGQQELFAHAIFQTIACASTTAIGASDYLRTALRKDANESNDVITLRDAMREIQAAGGKAAAAARIGKKRPSIQRAARAYKIELDRGGTKTTAIEAAHEATTEAHSTLRRWQKKGYFDPPEAGPHT